mgnify:CR=1 FL=1
MSRRDKLAPEPFNVYSWMLLTTTMVMILSICLIRGELAEYYGLSGLPWNLQAIVGASN